MANSHTISANDYEPGDVANSHTISANDYEPGDLNETPFKPISAKQLT